MGAAKKLKALTTIKEIERQSLSMKAIEVLPEILQTRATVDIGFVNAYANAMAAGSIFPPVIVYRTPDGRLLLADGFHRYQSRAKLGLGEIDAQIREGTLEEAVLAGIESNFDPYHSRKVEMADRIHAAEMMMASDEFWEWGDTEIARRCGLHPASVTDMRKRYSIEHGRDLPVRTKCFKDGIFVKLQAYGITTSTLEKRGMICRVNKRNGRTFYYACTRNKEIGLGEDKAAAQLEFDKLVEEDREARSKILRARAMASTILKQPSKLRSFLLGRGILAKNLEDVDLACIVIGKSLLCPLPEVDYHSVLQAVGRLSLSRLLAKLDGRMIVVCRNERCDTVTKSLLVLANRAAIEFMTPEELLVDPEFAPKDAPPVPSDDDTPDAPPA